MSRWSRFFARSAAMAAHAPEALVRQTLQELAPDIVNVHSLHCGTFNGWGPELVGICAEHAPVVWTLHDMWSFTGRCIHSEDCRRFLQGCDAWCPTPDEYPALAPSAIRPAWQDRRRLFEQHAHIVGVSPSHWLAGEARAGLWAQHKVEVIPHAVPLDIYRPLDRARARRTLGIPADGPVILMAATDLAERRKGGPLIPHVFEHVQQRPCVLVTMGQGMAAIRDASMRNLPLGWVEEPERQALVYNAADIVLHPAVVDNFPNVLLEAAACGTPVVAFAVGGVPEMVKPGQTGWLAPEVTAEALGKTLGGALAELEAGKDLRQSCRSWAERQYAGSRQAESYGHLFATLATGRRRLAIAQTDRGGEGPLF